MARRQRQEGYVIVVVTALLVVLLGFAAFAVDIGILYGSRASLQRAADAAALAGAYTFISEPRATQPATAEDRARSTAYRNSVFGSYIQAAEVSVAVDTNQRRVTVNITHNENTFFAKALSWTSATVAVQAIAEASASSTSAYCTKPWFIPNTILSTLDPCSAQSASPQQIMIDPSTTPFSVTQWANDKIATGFQFNLKPGVPANAAGPGEFFCIRLADSSGGNDYRTNISSCTPQSVTCGAFYGVEPGNMIGPTKSGVEDLTTIFGSTSPDTWVSVDVYQYPDSTTGPTSHQIIVAPIWDVGDSGVMNCDPASPDYNKLKGGSTVQIRVVGFATLFIEGMGGGGFTCEYTVTSCGTNDVIARLVGLSACDTPGGGIDPTETGPFSLPLRLIRTN